MENVLPIVHMLNAIRLELQSGDSPEVARLAEHEVASAFALARAGETYTADEVEAAVGEADAYHVLNKLQAQRGENPTAPQPEPARSVAGLISFEEEEGELEDDPDPF